MRVKIEHPKLAIERQEIEYESMSTFLALQGDRWHAGWHIEGSYWHTDSGVVLVTWERTLKS